MLKEKKINEYLDEYPVEWAVSMPKGCPPQDVLVPFEHTFFRYAISADSYTDIDFKSYAELNMGKDWGELLPLAVGLSVIDKEDKARKNLKLPFLKQFKGIIALSLNPTDGVVKQTGVRKSHFTWWRTTSFDSSNLTMLKL